MKRNYGKIAIHDSVISRLAINFLPAEFSGGGFGHNMNTHILMHILETICGYQYTFVSDPQIISGELDKYQVLILPLSVAIGKEQSNSIRKFVERGGILISDIRPGILDGNGKWDDNQVIPGLFGISYDKKLGRKLVKGNLEGELFGKKINIVPEQPFPVDPSVELKSAKALCQIDGIPLVIVNEVGKGKAICLNIPFTYYRGFNMPDSLYAYWGDENHNKLIASIIDTLFGSLNIERVLNVSFPGSDKKWLFGLDVAYYNDGEAQYVGLTKRRETDDEQPQEIILHTRKPGHVYDMFTGEYLGETDSWKIIVEQVDVRLFSVLPYKLNRINIFLNEGSVKQGSMITGKVKIDTDNKTFIRHVIHLEVIRPDGKSIQYLARNLETKDGTAEFSMPIALNEPEGKWTLEFTDIATRISKTIEVQVRENESK